MITNLIFSLIVFSFYQEQVPYKPSEEFEIKIDYIFKERPFVDKQTVNFDATDKEKRQRDAIGSMPYLRIELKVLTLAENEVRVRVINSEGKLAYNRKTAPDMVIKLDWGYTEDIKDKLIAHEFTVYFIDEKKNSSSRVLLTILDDGTFLVNEEKKGKF
jgi:hypothetical protein